MSNRPSRSQQVSVSTHDPGLAENLVAHFGRTCDLSRGISIAIVSSPLQVEVSTNVNNTKFRRTVSCTFQARCGGTFGPIEIGSAQFEKQNLSK